MALRKRVRGLLGCGVGHVLWAASGNALFGFLLGNCPPDHSPGVT